MLERNTNSVGSTTGSQLESEIIGLAANLAMPFALRLAGMFWDTDGHYHILESLAEGMGSDSERHSIPQK